MRAQKVYKEMGDVLRPKSKEDIRETAKIFIDSIDDLINAGEFIEEEEDDEMVKEAQEDMLKVCNIMKSNAYDVYYLVEEFPEYETLWNLLRKINQEFKGDLKTYHGHDMDYRINPKAKLAFGHSTDFNGIDVIFFNKPHLLKLIDGWEKSLI